MIRSIFLGRSREARSRVNGSRRNLSGTVCRKLTSRSEPDGDSFSRPCDSRGGHAFEAGPAKVASGVDTSARFLTSAPGATVACSHDTATGTFCLFARVFTPRHVSRRRGVRPPHRAAESSIRSRRKAAHVRIWEH